MQPLRYRYSLKRQVDAIMKLCRKPEINWKDNKIVTVFGCRLTVNGKKNMNKRKRGPNLYF